MSNAYIFRKAVKRSEKMKKPRITFFRSAIIISETKKKKEICTPIVSGQSCKQSNMNLNQKERELITELKTQEQLCVQKYDFYANQAKDPELKKLFKKILKLEQNHYDMLDALTTGTMPIIKSRKPVAVKYEPQATYTGDSTNKEFDKFLCTDIIATEKYVATAYNNDLFYFASPEVRNVLNAIMTDEQNHAEMIWKYKTVNKMVA